MKYAEFIDIPDFERHRQALIDFRNTRGNTNTLWWCHYQDEVEQYLPELAEMFKDQYGLTVKQLIYFCIPKNDLSVTDAANPESVFIHIDAQDEDWTLFEPTLAINLPLEHCEGTTTLFYEKIDDTPDVFYPVYDCGGCAHDSVKEAYRFELTQPAILRINVPHGVHNPYETLRVVATIRFNEDLEPLLKML